MTIRQQGGIFGRNPTFNNVEADGTLTVSGQTTFNSNITIQNDNAPKISILDSNGGFAAATFTSENGGRDLAIFAPQDIIFDQNGLETARFLLGGGLTFNGDTAAANALDDYEEGTWSPVISDAISGGNTGTSTVSYATYTKIGNVVYLKARLFNMNTTGMGTGNMYIRGLPFTASGDNDGILTTSFFTAAANSLGVFPSVDNGTSYLKLKEVISGGVYINADTAQFASGTADLWITITYNT